MHSLLSVQMLRALAAAMVVLHHIQLNLALGFGLPEALPNLAVGSAGVDIFFGISGFVMVISSDRLFARPGAAKTFITRRLIRIVPLYWAVTSIYVVALGGGYTLAHTLASYLFVPFPGPGGVMQPVHVVGWTLNYEMFFYALFALAIALPRRRAVCVLTVAMIVFVAAGKILPSAIDALAFWSRPIMLNFVLGLALGLAYLEGWRLPRIVAGLMMAAAAFLFLASDRRAVPLHVGPDRRLRNSDRASPGRRHPGPLRPADGKASCPRGHGRRFLCALPRPSPGAVGMPHGGAETRISCRPGAMALRLFRDGGGDFRLAGREPLFRPASHRMAAQAFRTFASAPSCRCHRGVNSAGRALTPALTKSR